MKVLNFATAFCFACAFVGVALINQEASPSGALLHISGGQTCYSMQEEDCPNNGFEMCGDLSSCVDLGTGEFACETSTGGPVYGEYKTEDKYQTCKESTSGVESQYPLGNYGDFCNRIKVCGALCVAVSGGTDAWMAHPKMELHYHCIVANAMALLAGVEVGDQIIKSHLKMECLVLQSERDLLELSIVGKCSTFPNFSRCVVQRISDLPCFQGLIKR